MAIVEVRTAWKVVLLGDFVCPECGYDYTRLLAVMEAEIDAMALDEVYDCSTCNHRLPLWASMTMFGGRAEGMRQVVEVLLQQPIGTRRPSGRFRQIRQWPLFARGG